MVAAQSNGASPGKRPSRRAERIFAFKVLYGILFIQDAKEQDLARAFRVSPDRPEQINPDQFDIEDSYAWLLCSGVWEKRDNLDKTLVSLSRNWRLERIGKVEITLLRIALFEMLRGDPDVPPKVAINEALELSKQFSDEKSRIFVNGVLDAAVKAMDAGTLHTIE